MLWMVLVSLFVLAWAWGFVTGATGGMIHLLLVAAVATGLMGVLRSGRRNVI